MRRFAGIFIIVIFCVMWLCTISGSEMKKIGCISGTALKAIKSAMPTFEKQGLKLELYKVTVYEEDSAYDVIFDSPSRPAGQMGSSPDLAAFNVEVSKDGFKVIKSYYAK